MPSADPSRAVPAAAPWLARPGEPGAMGALLDECARAAEDFCRAVEAFDAASYRRESGPPGGDPDTRSPRAVARHVVGAAHRYAHYLNERLGRPFVDRFLLPDEALPSPADVRPALREALAVTEDAVAPLRGLSEAELAELTFRVRWGPTYDPDMLLEHAVCHLLRHRRQLERWPTAPA